MFDKYYANKIRSKSPITNTREMESENIYNLEENEKLNNDINNLNLENNYNNEIKDENVGHGAEIENLIKEYKEKYGSDEELEKMINEYNKNKPEPNLDQNINNNVKKK